MNSSSSVFGTLIGYVVVWAVSAAITGALAARKNRSALAWAVGGALCPGTAFLPQVPEARFVRRVEAEGMPEVRGHPIRAEGFRVQGFPNRTRPQGFRVEGFPRMSFLPDDDSTGRTEMPQVRLVVVGWNYG
jgi:hypothetical protein